MHFDEGWLIQWLFLCFVIGGATALSRLSAVGAMMLQGSFVLRYIWMTRCCSWWAPGAREGNLWPCFANSVCPWIRVAWLKVNATRRSSGSASWSRSVGKTSSYELENTLETSMVGVRRLRSFASRLNWTPGVCRGCAVLFAWSTRCHGGRRGRGRKH